jgi:hypothetical protein
MIYKLLTLLLLCFVIALPAIAGVYRWENPPGKINFSNVPPEPADYYQFGTWSSEFAKQKNKETEEIAKKKAQAEEQAKAEKLKVLAAKAAKVRRLGNGNDMSSEEEKKIQELSSADIEKIGLDKCGVFKAYVLDYKEKLPAGCISKLCKIYAGQLLKYKTKVKQYCK